MSTNKELESAIRAGLAHRRMVEYMRLDHPCHEFYMRAWELGELERAAERSMLATMELNSDNVATIRMIQTMRATAKKTLARVEKHVDEMLDSLIEEGHE